MPTCSAKSGKHRSEKAQRECPLHGDGARQRLAGQQATSALRSLPEPSMATKEGLPVWSGSMGGYPREGCYNIGFGECVDFGDQTLGVVRSTWSGTRFEDCVFPNGLVHRDGLDKGVRVGLLNCLIESNCSLGRRGSIAYSSVHGLLKLHEGARAEHVEVHGDLQLDAEASAVETYAKSVLIRGRDASYSASKAVESVQIEAYPLGDCRVHLEQGGVVQLPEDASVEDITLTGDRTRIAIRHGNSLESGLLADLRYKMSTSRDKDDPLWVAANNDPLWEHLIESGAATPWSTPETISEDALLVGLLVHRNP